MLNFAPAAQASKSIPYFYNNEGDKDAKARFSADAGDYGSDTGDTFRLFKISAGTVFIQWNTDTSGSGKESYSGENDTGKNFVHNFAEDRYVKVKVCEEKGAFPDDCSSYKTGYA
ncbi:hypothetical protein [Aeromicrobium sp. 9AM]|uniref:hypothetical protein n=1 Tax=Aeromicrobium sp. 9AM TaxID=2653126 RepID=UPI0013573B1D|nr:hypothetical protein [Aeromicrobium sp. 9AM]